MVVESETSANHETFPVVQFAFKEYIPFSHIAFGELDILVGVGGTGVTLMVILPLVLLQPLFTQAT